MTQGRSRRPCRRASRSTPLRSAQDDSLKRGTHKPKISIKTCRCRLPPPFLRLSPHHLLRIDQKTLSNPVGTGVLDCPRSFWFPRHQKDTHQPRLPAEGAVAKRLRESAKIFVTQAPSVTLCVPPLPRMYEKQKNYAPRFRSA